MSDSHQGANSELRQLLPDAFDYPSLLRRCSEGNDPPSVKYKGNLGALNKTLTGFFW